MTVRDITKKERNDLDVAGALEWRCIGPFRGGRAVASVGHPTERQVFYMGCAGGVWKTEDGGVYWENISDGFFQTAAVGALAISESDPNVLYAGMGESCIAVPRLHWTSQADGVYRSTDGGRTWVNVGLRDSQHISRIRVHPGNPDLVYVAVVGHLEGPSKEKGIYRSEDGGETWEHVLYRDDDVGCNDLSMDPANPRILYAGMWQVRRSYWNTYSGGPGASLYRSTDGGDSWTDITANPGMTAGVKGRFGVSASGARPGRVWALCDGGDAPGVSRLKALDRGGGLFRSDDYGSTWERVSNDPELTVRPYYYNHVFAHPQDPDTVYVLNQPFWKSVDGGRSFKHVEIPHYDNHDLWIDPNDPDRMAHANDGGVCVSFNGGKTWSSVYNQPTAELYHITVDTQTPYRVYATQQDNTAISVPSRSNAGAIRWSDCYPTGSSESGHIVVRPDNPNIVTSGALGSSPGSGPIMLRYDHATGQSRSVTVWPDRVSLTMEGRKYRFEWDNPIVLSPHDPDVMYSAANVVFKTTDEGASWHVISPDLTRNELVEREEIDPVTNIAPFERCTITRIAESTLERGVIWAGTSDGLVHLSRAEGGSWTDVTPPGLPEWTPVDCIEASSHEPGTAYVAANGYAHGDYAPHLYKTVDYGSTWRTVVNGIREIDFIRVVREDPARAGLLYAGTEGGPYVSFDGCESWQPLQLNLPKVPIHDMVVKDADLVVATHGRSIWILDDVTPLRQIDSRTALSSPHLFDPKPATRYLYTPYTYSPTPPVAPRDGKHKAYQLRLGSPAAYWLNELPDGRIVPKFLDAGSNPPDGALIDYYLSSAAEMVEIAFADSRGGIVDAFSSVPDPLHPGPRPSTGPGLNRFIWDLRVPGPDPIEGDPPPGRRLLDPMVPPGVYEVRLTVDGRTMTTSLEVSSDPRSEITREALEAQYELMIRIRDKTSEANRAVSEIRRMRRQVESWTARAENHPGEERLRQAADLLAEKLDRVEGELTLGPGAAVGEQKASRGSFYSQGLIYRLGPLADTVALGDGGATAQSLEVFGILEAMVDEQTERLRTIQDEDLDAFTSVVHELGVPPITT